MDDRWKLIEQAFSAKGLQPSDLFAPPATDDELGLLASTTGLPIPAEVESFFRIHNGQRPAGPGVLFGIELLSTSRVIENWQTWKSVVDDGLNEDLADSMSSQPPGVIKPLYVNLKWLPLTHDQGGNHFGLDFDPGPAGVVGQVIAFGRDEDEKKLIAKSFTDFLDMIVEELTTIDWTLDSNTGWIINDPLRGDLHYHEWPRTVT
ncbi:SMI1/KNR4 family protein [Bremerella sp. JC817]|uniref:SMI1/KNR4 family protein n=1 Tax=Bremerella sp. JC817 TaxID=3231756 RepID=UPI00345793F1